jgi:hypothetical protein
MSESRPDQSQPAGQEPYGIGRMLEDTVSALVRAGDVFAGLAERPAPSYGVMIPNLLVVCAVVCAAILLRVCVVAPELLQASPSMIALAAAAALILAVPLSFVAAGVLHAFMLLSGGEGDFQRSYQAASISSSLIALQALLNWFDWVWALPALLVAYLGTAAARTVHRAPVLRAGVVFCLVAAFCISGQWWLREQLSRWSQAARAMRTAASLTQQLQQLQQISLPPEPGAEPPTLPPDALPFAPERQSGGASAPPESPQPSGLSSLELLSPPQGGGHAERPAPLQAQAQSIQQAATNLLTPIMTMLQNPALTKGLSPEQAKNMSDLRSMLAQMQKNMASGQKTTPEEQAAMASQFQSSMMQFMTQMRPPSPSSRQGLSDPGQKTTPTGRTAPAQKEDGGNPPQADAGGPAQAPASPEPAEKAP